MAQSINYPNAPIVEAVIDLRVKTSEGFSREVLDRFIKETSGEYQNTEIQREIQIVADATDASVRRVAHDTGVRVRSSDGRHIVQARADGFAFSRLAPYESWAPFVAAAKQMWARYRHVFRPTQVWRVATRYVNKIDIPLPIRDLSDFFRTHLKVSEDLPQSLLDYRFQFAFPESTTGSRVNVMQGFFPSEQQDRISVILDIDVFTTDEFSLDEDRIWAKVESFRNVKNRTFEDCITHRTRELFGHEPA